MPLQRIQGLGGGARDGAPVDVPVAGRDSLLLVHRDWNFGTLATFRLNISTKDKAREGGPTYPMLQEARHLRRDLGCHGLCGWPISITTTTLRRIALHSPPPHRWLLVSSSSGSSSMINKVLTRLHGAVTIANLTLEAKRRGQRTNFGRPPYV